MKIIKNSLEGIKVAAEILKENGVVAFPTETVYGLGANAFSQEAVTKVYKIKRRPSFNPLIIHVSSYDMAKEYGVFNDLAKKLTQKHWPGALTIVVKRKKSDIVDAATARLETIALRCPSNIIARDLIRELDKPIAWTPTDPAALIGEQVFGVGVTSSSSGDGYISPLDNDTSLTGPYRLANTSTLEILQDLPPHQDQSLLSIVYLKIH